jgi:hypothetical protein
LRRFAEESGAAHPGALAHRLQILCRGAFVAASQGEMDAIREARVVAQLILANEGLEA